MELTTKGFKKPTSGDANDLYQFVGDNMDLLEVELDKKSNSNHTHNYNDLTGKPYFAGTSAPMNKNIFWIDTA